MPPPPRSLEIALMVVGCFGVVPLASLLAGALVSDRALQDAFGRGFLHGSMLWAAAFVGVAVVAIASRIYLWWRE